MRKFKTIISSPFFFPLLVIYYGIFYTIFGETYPKMLSIDGRIFMEFVTNIKNSTYFDTYYVFRVLPSLVIRYSFNLLSIDLEFNKIFKAFQVLNFISIALTCYYLKQIFVLLKISFKNQMLGFVLFIFNFAIIKYPFYLPVMTDTFALMLCTVMLYYYLKSNTVAVTVCALLLAFTWPMGFYQGLILIALPFNSLPYKPLNPILKKGIYTLSVLFILSLIVLFIFIQKIDIEVYFVPRINKNFLLISIFGVCAMFFFFAKLFFNQTLFDINLFKNKLSIPNILSAVGLFVVVKIGVGMLGAQSTPLYTTEQMLRDPTVYSLIRPFLSIVADTSYMGIIICLVIFFWTSLSKVVSQMGWGLVAALALDLFLFGVTPQSRHLINLLPWLIVFFVKAINRYSFKDVFYWVVGLLSLLVSKVWFILNNFEAYPPMQLDANGSMGFPHQKFWMQIGPWMSEDMYILQGELLLVIMIILFFTLYRIDTKARKWQVVAKFK